MAGQSGVYRGVSAEDRTTERRRRLLDAALTRWADAESRVTMTGICAEAGLTERYFYESFASLDDALTAVLDDIAVEIEERARAAVTDAGSDPAARVRASVRAFVQLLADDPRKGRVAIIEAGAMPALRARRTELLRHFAHRAAADAEQLYGLARTHGHDGEVAGLLFVGGVAELVTAWLDGVLEASPDELVDAAARMFLGLYG